MRPTRNALIAALDGPSCDLLASAEAAARDLGAGLWLVGGATRDLAARRRIHDLDLAFAAPAREFVDALAARLPGAAIERTDRFGTATVTHAGARLDLARLRREHYVMPGALPEVRSTDRIEADLARRDFTVNAIALTLVAPVGSASTAGEVVDPFDGLADLAARRLRVLHDRSFVDDATRLWRGARTAALFHLEPDAATARLIEEGARWLEEISGERLWNELAFTAARGRACGTLERLEAWGVLGAVHPRLSLLPPTAAALTRRGPMPPERLAAVLLAPHPTRTRAAVLERLAARREVRATVEDTARLLEAGPHASPATLDLDALAALEGVTSEARIAARWLAPEPQRTVQEALRRWERTRPWLTADEVARLGVPRGPALGRALADLRRGRYLGTLSTRAAARRHVRDIAEAAG
jgi:tRNA nucleotidyltransferase (CCA-adding enzyme)